MDDKDFLVQILTLSDSVLNNDPAAIAGISAALNSNTLTTEQLGVLKSTVMTLIESSKDRTEDPLILAVNSIQALNKSFLLAMIELKRLSVFDNLEASKQLITDKLNDTTIVLDDNHDKFDYYTILVRLTIVTKDSVLIKTAIDKIQSL